MSNIRKWLEDAEEKFGERIEAIVIGPMGAWRYHELAKPHEDVVLARDEGLRLLDYEYDSGYGAADCNSLYAWTPTRVLFISEYDGSTRLSWIPRSPAAITPSFDGEFAE